MQFVDEFRDPALAKVLLEGIAGLRDEIMARRSGPLQIMEFCGGHTHTIFRYGIEQLLPDWIELVHGPGCPVCVLPMGRVDDCVALAQRPEVIFTTFGDAMRVPGSQQSLLEAKAAGADVRMVYSPLDALALARENPQREVIFFALGFETTMPSTALTVLQAQLEGVSNFSLLCHHITTVPTIKSILDDERMILDGFLAPGHVCMVIGTEPLQFVAQQYAKPLVITGFEPLDILQALYMLLQQIAAGRCVVENQYARVVSQQGNSPGLAAMAQVFELRESSGWRGLGAIEKSGIKMTEAFAAFDAERRFAVQPAQVPDPEECRCGEVIRGAIKPWQCELFGKTCTPHTPLGALMVSSEGPCAAYYHFADRDALAEKRIGEQVPEIKS